MFKYVNYLFEDEDSDEMFIVEIKKTDKMTKSESLAKALYQANRFFNKPKFISKISAIEAEMLGYDTY